MTVERLTNSFIEYVTYLYSGRDWARWELLTVALTTMVLLLFILVSSRRAKAKRIRKKRAKQLEKNLSILGTKLDTETEIYQSLKGDNKGRRVVPIPKINGNKKKWNGSKKRWKETTKQWKNLQKLIEQLQYEIVKYKEAEENLEQQFIKLKAANEQLRRGIAGNGQVTQMPELSNTRTADSLGKRQNRILNSSGTLAEK